MWGWRLPRPLGHPLLWRLGLTAVIGLSLGLTLIARSTPPPASGAGSPPSAGARSSIDEATERAVQSARERLAQWLNLELPDGSTLRVRPPDLGIELDAVRARTMHRRAAALEARRGEGAVGTTTAAFVPLEIDAARFEAALLALKEQLDQRATDARIDVENGRVAPEQGGRLLDVDATAQRIEAALEWGAPSARLAFMEEVPNRASAELADVRYDALLGFFETPYDPGQRAEDRTYNLRLTASRLDGYVLSPGQELDFNAVVGPRDEANGYRVAKVIAQGELVDGLGGGTCQISGTLHAAALFAGLEIVERHPHTRPSSYIKLGFDAAVAYPTLNLRLKNPYDFPVVVRETVAGGRVRAEIRGARRPQVITVIRRIDAAQPFEQVVRADVTLPRGARVLAQRGVPGFELRRYRVMRDGAHTVREVFLDRYPPTAQLVRLGTGPRTLSRAPLPSDDPQPEYVADELLVLSQPAELGAPLVEQRVPGRFGVRGWSKQIGAPVWNLGG